jgi:hypothetical protein
VTAGPDLSGAESPNRPELDPELAQVCIRAIVTAANDLELDPGAFADELAQGEIGLLVAYLQAAAPHVTDLELRTRIDSLLHRLTSWTRGDR